MQKFELSFDSIGCNETYTKEITILVVAPDKFDDKTGAMLFCHGWGGNRFQHQEFMKAVADKFNLLCLSPEYRMSGFDYAPRNGYGWFKPYDLSFYQTFDALLALRFILQLHTNLNHKRIFVYGGSQGGHIALLSAIYAPNTFAAVYSSSAMACVPNQPNLAEATGRFFTDAECKVRSVPYLIDRLNTPLFMEHGTGDETVDHALNTAVVEALMKERGKPCEVVYYEGARHDLSPVITKLDAFMRMAPKFLSTYENQRMDDFTAASQITIPCGDKTLSIDWARDSHDPKLLSWQ
ncbi:MAG: alpha/beta fold hydrolase [Victivallales bacterium]|nr:alpha/beta fold hydrolase [Victivallales bacterium]